MRKHRDLEGSDASVQTFLVPLGILSVLSVLMTSVIPQEEDGVSKGEWKIEKITGGAILDGSEAVYGRASTPYSVIRIC